MSPPSTKHGLVECDAGLRLYWEAWGTGPAIICCNGVGVSTFFWKYVVEHFSPNYQVVLWDYRGHGKSEAPSSIPDCDLSIQACARDLGRVMEALELKDAVLLGHSMGCQVALERYHQDPRSVQGLGLFLGSAGRVLETFFDTNKSVRIHGLLRRLVNRMGPRANELVRPLMRSPAAWPFTTRAHLVDPDYASREDFQPYLDHLQVIDTRLFLEMVGQAHNHDAFPWLHEVQSPTLVVAAENDRFTPMHVSERMVGSLPNAEIMVLADGSHAAIIEQPQTINHRLERFFDEQGLLATNGSPHGS